MKYLLAICLLVIGLQLSAQETANGHFLVEFDKFSPPIQDIVREFEGRVAEPFMANDINGNEHFLGNYKGQKVILWFWSVNSSIAAEQMSAMSLLQERNKDLKIIAFAKEPKAEVQEYMRASPMDLPVIPNGEIFGQMAYGADLGSPRMFLIDKQGVIKVVLPEQAFTLHFHNG